MDEFLGVDKCFGLRNAVRQKLNVLFVKRAEPVLGLPVESWQPVEPVFVPTAQEPTGIFVFAYRERWRARSASIGQTKLTASKLA